MPKLPLAVVAVLTLTACSAGAPEEDSDQASQASAASPLSSWRVRTSGRLRTVRVHEPSPMPSSGLPLVLAFHGQYSDATQQESLSRLAKKADEVGFLLLLPEGFGASWNDGHGCCGIAGAFGVDDLTFVRDILDAATTRWSVDPRRVYATGISNGAYLVHQLGCAMADRFAAIAPVAGVLLEPPACRPSRPLSVLSFHGTADTFVPYEGTSPEGEPGARETDATWAERSGCSSTLTTSFAAGSARCEVHEGCREGSAVGLCTLEGGGHTWPGGPDVRFLGPTNRDLDATDAIWAFFEAHPLPEAGP